MSQDRVLSAVRAGYHSITEVERVTGIPAGQVTTHLRRLVMKGLVEHHGHNDWRPAGQCALAEAWK